METQIEGTKTSSRPTPGKHIWDPKRALFVGSSIPDLCEIGQLIVKMGQHVGSRTHIRSIIRKIGRFRKGCTAV